MVLTAPAAVDSARRDGQNPRTASKGPKLAAGSRHRSRSSRRTPWRTALLVGALVAIGWAGLLALQRLSESPTAWAALDTSDVHALAFDPEDAGRLLIGHHAGLLASRDGGRSWSKAALRDADAMNVWPHTDGSIMVAGHELLASSSDSGATWQQVENNLPGLDLHSFVRDPADSQRAWAFAAGFGLFESTDGGRGWQLRQEGNWGALTAYRRGDTTVLLGIGPEGLVTSLDGGATWSPLAYPGAPLSGGLAVSADGGAIYAATINGLRQSIDGGESWQATGWDRPATAVAVAPSDPSLLAVVDEDLKFYRSSDAGGTWPGP